MQTGVQMTGLSQLHAHAYALAACYHNGQFDKAGKPYFEHVLKVKDLLKTEDIELQIIAILHDLFEDTPVTRTTLEGIGYSERVIHGIECLTKLDGESEEEYKNKVKSNKDSILVKLADLTHNSDIRRLKGLRPKDFARTVKYQEFFLELEEIKRSWNV